MIKFHEVFSTSITLDEVSRAHRIHSNDKSSKDLAPSSGVMPINMCHASSILPLKHERDHQNFVPFNPFLCAFFAGSYEGKSDTAIYIVRIENDGCHSTVEKISCPRNNKDAHWNPVLFYLNQGEAKRQRRKALNLDPDTINLPQGVGEETKTTIGEMLKSAPSDAVLDDVIALVYKVGDEFASWKSFVALSFDNGRSFTKPRELIEGDLDGRGPVRNKPYIIRKGPYAGRMLFPATVEHGEWTSYVDFTDDNLLTLRRSNAVALSKEQVKESSRFEDGALPVSEDSELALGLLHPTLYEDLGVHEMEPGDLAHLSQAELDAKYSTVHMLLRSSLSKVYQADSTDGGATWSKPYPIDLANNNSGLDVVTYVNHLIFCGNVVEGNFSKRTPLSLYLSADGKNFREMVCLENDPNGEFSFPCLQIDRRHNILYVSYTDYRKAITVRIFRVRYDLDNSEPDMSKAHLSGN